MRTLLTLLCCLMVPVAAAADLTAPEQAVVMDLHRPWLDGSNWDNNTPPAVYGVDAAADVPRFTIVDNNAQGLWVYRMALPVNVAKYPIVSIKYRAKNISKDSPYLLRLVVEKDGARSRQEVWKGSDIIADNQEHELKQSLRELGADGSITTFGIGFHTDQGPGTLELLDVRFSSDTAGPRLADDSAVKIRVTDQKDQPLSGAMVILDAERANFARSGKTDASGVATITPITNDCDKHMLRIEKEGVFPVELADAASPSGQMLVVKTMPASRYGGVAKDSQGKPAAMSRISIKFKPELLDQVPTRFQTNIVTDERGQWSSAPLPADAGQLIVSLTSRNGASSTELSAADFKIASVASAGSKSSDRTETARDIAKPAADAKPEKPAPPPISAVVQKIDDSTTGLGWTGVDGDQLLVVLHPQPGKDEPAKIPLADVTELTLKRNSSTSPPAPPATRPANTLPASRVMLVNDDRLYGSVVGWSDKKLSIHPNVAPDSTIEVPVSSLKELWCGTQSDVKKAQALKEEPGLEDIAFATKDNEVIAVRGIAVGIDDDALHFRFDNADRKIGLNRLVGIIMAKGEEAPATDALYEQVSLMNDDQLSGKLVSLDGKTLAMQTLAGTSVRLPIDQVTKITTRNGRLVYLSDLKPAKVEQTPYFDRLLEYRVDKSLSGRPIILADGTYAHGISVHSRCVLTYNLDGKFSQFKSKVGFQLPEGKVGDCVIRVLGDGKTRFEKLEARGDQPPADLKLAVDGVRELTLEVDFGKNDDVGDRVAWANARLLRAEK